MSCEISFSSYISILTYIIKSQKTAHPLLFKRRTKKRHNKINKIKHLERASFFEKVFAQNEQVAYLICRCFFKATVVVK